MMHIIGLARLRTIGRTTLPADKSCCLFTLLIKKHWYKHKFQEDKSRVKIFRDSRRGNSWQPFLNLLNRQDEFVQHMTARIIAKLACWHPQLMEKSDLHFYLSWLKDQLKSNVSLTLSKTDFLPFWYRTLKRKHV